MTIQLHLAPADLAGVRFASTIGPLAEAWESIEVLRDRAAGAGWVTWRARLRASKPDSVEAGLRVYSSQPGCPADLVAVIGHHPSPGKAVAAFLSASTAQLTAEAEFVTRCTAPAGRPLPGFTGSRVDRENFLRALHKYAMRLVGGRWGTIESLLSADLRSRTGLLRSEGLGAVLDTLHPSVHWNESASTLLIEGGADREVELGGRGLLVAPKFFASRVKVHLPMVSDAPAILAYPAVSPEIDHRISDEPSSDGLAGILGSTRAAMLKAISEGITAQQDLASVTETTGAAIGQHAAKLRAAGLITTVRREGRAFHVLTAAGEVIVANAGEPGGHAPTRVGPAPPAGFRARSAVHTEPAR